MTMMNNPAPNDDPGEFAALRSFDMLAAYLHLRHGEQMLRAVFTAGNFSREDLIDCAGKLDAKRLDHVAAIMRDLAADAPSGIDDNPHLEGTHMWHYWRRRWIQKRRLATGELEADLRRRHAQKQQQTQAQQAKASHTRH
jgi:hypothetical protein